MNNTINMETKNQQKNNINYKEWKFSNIFEGRYCFFGTDTPYIKKQINILENKKRTLDEDIQLRKYYNELGRNNTGGKKPKCCWNFIDNGVCNHTNTINFTEGQIINGLWHPDIDEKLYLKNRKKNI